MPTATLTKTTRSGRPKLPAINKGKVLAEQAEKIAAAVAAVKADTDKDLAIARLHKLAEIEAKANAVIEELDEPMRKMGLSLALHEGARAVYNAMGVSRELFSLMTSEALGDWPERPVSWDETVVARAKARKVLWHRNAATELPKIAARVVAAKSALKVIRPMRDELVTELHNDHGLNRVEIADLIGRTPSRVSHIAAGADHQ